MKSQWWFGGSCALFLGSALLLLRAGNHGAAFCMALIGLSQALNWRGWVAAERKRLAAIRAVSLIEDAAERGRESLAAEEAIILDRVVASVQEAEFQYAQVTRVPSPNGTYRLRVGPKDRFNC